MYFSKGWSQHRVKHGEVFVIFARLIVSNIVQIYRDPKISCLAVPGCIIYLYVYIQSHRINNNLTSITDTCTKYLLQKLLKCQLFRVLTIFTSRPCHLYGHFTCNNIGLVRDFYLPDSPTFKTILCAKIYDISEPIVYCLVAYILSLFYSSTLPL